MFGMFSGKLHPCSPVFPAMCSHFGGAPGWILCLGVRDSLVQDRCGHREPSRASFQAAKNTCLLENGRAEVGGLLLIPEQLSHQCCLSELRRRSTAQAAESEVSQRMSTSIKQEDFLLTAECIVLITFPHLFLVCSRIMQIR